jgi:uncharacterized protein (DUF4415 family)
MAGEDIRHYSAAELRALRKLKESRTRPDAPTIEPDAAFWEKARVVEPVTGKVSVHLRVDREVLAWFKAQGEGHLTRMNAVLRSYVQAQRERRGSRRKPRDC